MLVYKGRGVAYKVFVVLGWKNIIVRCIA